MPLKVIEFDASMLPTVISLVVVLPFVVTSSRVTEIAAEEMLVIPEPSPTKAVAVTVPVTSNAVAGLVLPIPTLPDESTVSADVPPNVIKSSRLILAEVPLPSNTALGSKHIRKRILI